MSIIRPDTIKLLEENTDFKLLDIRPDTIKLLEENTDFKLLDISLGDDFLDLITKLKGNKSKNKHVGLCQTKKLL